MYISVRTKFERGTVMAEQINTISDLMDQIQQDTSDIRSGVLDETRGRTVLAGRRLQVKVAELVLQAHRLTRKNGAALPLSAAPEEAAKAIESGATAVEESDGKAE